MQATNSYKKRFAEMTDSQLIEAFNEQVGNSGWTSARADYLSDLREEFFKRSIDCSVIESADNGLSYSKKIRLSGDDVVKIIELDD